MPGRHLVLNTTNGHSHPVPASGAIPPQDHVSNYEPTQSVSVDLDPPSPLQGGSINSEEELGQLLNDSQDEGNESDDEEMDPFNDGATCLSTCAELNPNVVVIGTRNGHVLWWDRRSGDTPSRAPVYRMSDRGVPSPATAAGGVRCLVDLSHSSFGLSSAPTMCSGGGDGMLRVFDLRTGGVLLSVHEQAGAITSILPLGGFNPTLGGSGEEKRILSSSMDASLAVTDLATGVSVKRPVIHDKGVLKAALVGKRGTKFVVTASSGRGHAALFNPDSSAPVESYLHTGHTSADERSRAHSLGSMYSGSSAGVQGTSGAVSALVAMGGGGYGSIVTGGHDGFIYTHDIDTIPRGDDSFYSIRNSLYLGNHHGFVTAAAKVTTNIVATGSGDHSIRTWNIHNRCLSGVLNGHTAGVQDVISPSVGSIVSCGADGVRVWDIEREHEIIVHAMPNIVGSKKVPHQKHVHRWRRGKWDGPAHIDGGLGEGLMYGGMTLASPSPSGAGSRGGSYVGSRDDTGSYAESRRGTGGTGGSRRSSSSKSGKIQPRLVADEAFLGGRITNKGYPAEQEEVERLWTSAANTRQIRSTTERHDERHRDGRPEAPLTPFIERLYGSTQGYGSGRFGAASPSRGTVSLAERDEIATAGSTAYYLPHAQTSLPRRAMGPASASYMPPTRRTPSMMPRPSTGGSAGAGAGRGGGGGASFFPPGFVPPGNSTWGSGSVAF